MNTCLKLALVILTALALSSCRIDLSITGNGTVQTQDGTFNCTSDGTTQSGDCTQTYNIANDGTQCSPTDPDCTTITSGNSVTENFVAIPGQGSIFTGWSGGCWMGGVSGCNQEITYDNANQVHEVGINATFTQDLPPQAATYTYNYLGQKASKTVNGVTTYFTYDEDGQLQDEIDGSGNMIRSYVYMDGEYIAHIEETADVAHGATSSPALMYPINDHLDQPMEVWTSDAQLATEQYHDPFGNVYADGINTSTGMGTIHDQVKVMPWMQRETETGYYQNWNREYDPSTDSYTQSDPSGIDGGMDTYLYANASPVTSFDENGLCPKTCKGKARVIVSQWNRVGWTGAFPPKTINTTSITVDADQWGGVSKLRPYLNQISGKANDKFLFDNVADNMGGKYPKGFKNVRAYMESLFPGLLLLELPKVGKNKDLGVGVPVVITIPEKLDCPTGTTQE